MNAFSELITADRRLVLLRVLEEDPNYSHNEYVVQSCLSALGHDVSQDRVRTDLAWLAEQELVTLSRVGSDDSPILVARLTGRGADVAEGKTIVPGIKRPRPGV